MIESDSFYENETLNYNYFGVKKIIFILNNFSKYICKSANQLHGSI